MQLLTPIAGSTVSSAKGVSADGSVIVGYYKKSGTHAFIWTAGRPVAALAAARPRDLVLLALSGLTTSLSWIFYYRAMKTGTVSFVALVDKGSIIVTLVLSFLLLHEPFTTKTACGGGLTTGSGAPVGRSLR